MGEFKVVDLHQQKNDAAGNPVSRIYFKLPPLFAIYQTSNGVVVQFADEVEKARDQAASGARLNTLQRQIDALLDGWRTSGNSQDQARARRYDGRVAVALRLWLLDDAESAFAALEAVKQDIVEERTSFARFTYLQAALSAALLLFLALTALNSPIGEHVFAAAAKPFWLAGRAACVGAFFSIAIGIKTRTVLPDLRLRDNVSDSVLRIMIGVIAGGALLLMLQSGVVGDVQIAGRSVGGERYSWLLVAMLGFLAGFSERLVPDLLDTALSTTRTAVATSTAPLVSPPRPAGAPSAPTREPLDFAARSRALEIWVRRGGEGAVSDLMPEAKRELGLTT